MHGSQHIIHAGDIGDPEILEKLRTIAPLTAIRGNIDKAPWCRKLALAKTEIAEVAGISIYLLHDLSQLDLQPEAAGCKVVIYGHSHVPKQETRNGVLYFNPGSAGPRRFKLPVTVGRLIVEAESVRGEIIPMVRLSQIIPATADADMLANATSIQVVVYSEGSHTIGLIVDRIVDIVEEHAGTESLTPRTGVVGSFVSETRVTDLLDLPSIVRAAVPGLLDLAETDAGSV